VTESAVTPLSPRGKILIVEDEAIIAMDMAHILRSRGCEIAGLASSGEDAVALAERLRPDLVFMDVRLKGRINGLQAGRLIRERLAVPVVFLTAFGDDVAADSEASLRGLPRVLKPFVEHEIEGVLNRFLPPPGR
jgi:CheY-like chemotaxis protein